MAWVSSKAHHRHSLQRIWCECTRSDGPKTQKSRDVKRCWSAASRSLALYLQRNGWAVVWISCRTPARVYREGTAKVHWYISSKGPDKTDSDRSGSYCHTLDKFDPQEGKKGRKMVRSRTSFHSFRFRNLERRRVWGQGFSWQLFASTTSPINPTLLLYLHCLQKLCRTHHT